MTNTLAINGVTGPMTMEDAWDRAGMLVALGRAIPPQKWVDEMVNAGEESGSFLTFGIMGGGGGVP